MKASNRIAQSMDVLMHQQHRTQAELALQLGTSRNRASRIMRGTADMTIDELFTVAKWLGTTTEQLERGYEVTPVLRAA